MLWYVFCEGGVWKGKEWGKLIPLMSTLTQFSIYQFKEEEEA